MRKITAILLAVLLLARIPAFAEETLEQQIAALPDVAEFQAMSREEQADAYNRTQYAYDAYMALPTAEEKDALEGAEEKFDARGSCGNTMTMPVENEEATGKVGYNQFAWAGLLVMAAMLVVPVLRRKHG